MNPQYPVKIAILGWLSRLVLGALSLLTIFAMGGGSLAADRPNIVLIYADDLGWSDVGFNGSRYYETPRIDRMAEEGMRFTDAYVAAPNCAPSRATLMFGQYSPRTGCYTVGNPANVPGHAEGLTKVSLPENNMRISLEKICFAEPLSKAGYATALFGKWHLGESGEYLPTNRGFTHGFILPNVHIQDDFGPFTTLPSRPSEIGVRQSDFLVNEALKFIEEQKGNPFFVQISFYVSVHASNLGTHISPDPSLTGKYHSKPAVGYDRDPKFAAKVEHMDHLVGRVLDHLDTLGLSDNTLVIFYSDNGGVGNYLDYGAASTRSYTDNSPLRAGKSTLYEGGVRVPLVMRWPGVISAGSMSSIPVTSVDFYPTFLELARAAAPENHVLDGVSLLPLLKGEPRPLGEGHESRGRMLWSPYALKSQTKAKGDKLPVSDDLLSGARPIFWHFPIYYGNRIKDPVWVNTPNSAVRLGRFKLIEFFEDQRVELYDVVADIGERTDLANTHPEIVTQLRDMLHIWQKETGAFIPQPHALSKFEATSGDGGSVAK